MSSTQKCLEELREALTRSRRETINARPRTAELLDPTPLEMPVDQQGPPTMRELVQEYVENVLSQQASQEDFGTFEEEDDFEIDEREMFDVSGYEVHDYEMEEEIVPGHPDEPPKAEAGESQDPPPPETEPPPPKT